MFYTSEHPNSRCYNMKKEFKDITEPLCFNLRNNGNIIASSLCAHNTSTH